MPNPRRALSRPAALAVAAILAAGVVGAAPPAASAVSATIVISQVYGGGGNTGATLKNDFIELYNRSAAPVAVTGWSVQYASTSGSTWQRTNITGTIPAGGYYLVAEAAGAGGTLDLPTPDATGSIPMSATAGKVALVSNQTTLSGTCPTGLVDLVGYGSATNCSETAPTANLSNTTAALRTGGGATDTDSNVADFAIGAPNPRNAASAQDAAPAVLSTAPANGASGIALSANVSVTFSEPVNLASPWYSLSCTVSGPHTATVSGGPTTFTLDPDVDFAVGDLCTVVVVAAAVTDQDTSDPPDAMVADYLAGFSTVSACALPFTPIHAIQGSGPAAAITGVVTTLGVVVGDHEGPSPALRGFYLQDLAGDADPATSDGIFVFNGNSDSVSLGDVVRVTGTAADFQDQTQIGSVTSIVACGTGGVAPTDVTLPFASSTDVERFEGMLVRLPQTLTVTETFQLGRFGEVLLSSGGRLAQPTNVVAPGAPALALQAQNDLDQILVDDALQSQNPDPIVFARGGQPLSASNTLRGGDTATGAVGVMTYTWGGNAASPNAFRVRPIGALGGSILFQPANARPVVAPNVGGSVRVAAMNLLNYFNTFDGSPDTGDNCTLGVGGAPTDCRGADTAAEYARQWPKTVAAILAVDADVLGLVEVENDGYGPASAIADLVGKLNAATAPGTYAFIDADAGTGQVNALGTDAIKVGLIYRPASVTPVGTTAALNTAAFVNGGDSAARNRPSLAQAFSRNANGARFIVDVNHLKSKGSACDAPDAGDGQGNCNLVRVSAATQLAAWLASDPTGTGEPDVLILGDLNSYAKEDPIAALGAAGYADLLASFVGPSAYSYVFDGQWGYLDHVLGSPSVAAQVSGIAEHHVNADEPPVLDYNLEFKTANLQASLYAPDQYRMADHDPVVVGLTPSAPPVITSFSPTQGTTGTVVTITGTGFVDVTSVTIGGVPVPFTVVSPTTIVVTIAAGVRSGPIVVRTASGVGVSTASFTVTLAPAVLGFSPGAGRVGSLVTITGANLTYTKAVTIGGKAAAFRVASPSTITATVPAGAVTGRITVTSQYGSATSTKLFYVLS
jgi:hypothetical protein